MKSNTEDTKQFTIETRAFTAESPWVPELSKHAYPNHAQWSEWSRGCLWEYMTFKTAVRKAKQLELNYTNIGLQARVIHVPTKTIVWHKNMSLDQTKATAHHQIGKLRELLELLPMK